jgi:mRNA interferase MazF
VVIMAITSQLRARPRFAEFILAEWKRAGLLAPSPVKPVLTTIEKGLLLKKLGALQFSDLRSLRASLAAILG